MKKSKQDIITSRLNRIEGQVRGIERMYIKDSCDFVGIIEQIQAARAALAKVAEIVLTNEAKRCADKGDLVEFEKVVAKTFKTL